MSASPAATVRSRLATPVRREPRRAPAKPEGGPPAVPGYTVGEVLQRDVEAPPLWTARDRTDALVLLRRANPLLARRLLAVPAHPALLLPRALVEDPAGTWAVQDAVATAPLEVVSSPASISLATRHALLADAAEAVAHLHAHGVAGRACLPSSARVTGDGHLVLDVVASLAPDLLEPGWRAVALDGAASGGGAPQPSGHRADLEGLAHLAALLMPAGTTLSDSVGVLLDRALLDRALLPQPLPSPVPLDEVREWGLGPGDRPPKGSTQAALPNSREAAQRPTALDIAAAARGVAARGAGLSETAERRRFADAAAHEERALILAAPTLGALRARRRRTWRAAGALVLGIVAGWSALSLLDLPVTSAAEARQGATAAAPVSETAAETAAATTTSSPTMATPTVADLSRLQQVFRVRDAALATTDALALSRAVVPGSPAWRFDVVNLRALRAAGVSLQGLQTVIREAAAPTSVLPTPSGVASADHHPLEVVLWQEAHTRWRQGVPTAVAPTQPRCLAVVLAPDGRITDWGACQGG